MGNFHGANMEPVEKPTCNPYFSPGSTNKAGTKMGHVFQLGPNKHQNLHATYVGN